MKKSLFLLLALVAVFGLAASCGGGGDDDEDFNFNGNWAATFLVTNSNVPQNFVGQQYVDVINIVQSGNEVTVTMQSFNPFLVMRGTCDPGLKTFNATGIATGGLAGLRVDINGASSSDESMVGAWAMSKGPLVTAGTWSGDLFSRAAAGAVGVSGTMIDVAKGLF